jgi:putative nucleotidyltransferase with HDIG domain
MTVPSREEAVRLLLSLDPPAWHLRHSRAVAEVAAWLARRIAQSSSAPRLDRRLVETAALLHDVDKALPKGARRPGMRHGEAGATWLAEHGHPELLEAVSLHPVTVLVTADGAAALARAPLEVRVVAYADKRARQRVVAMTDRFARWTRRHRDGWSPETTAVVWGRARDLEREVCGLAACRPEDVARLAWTGPALASARATIVRATP